MRRFWVVFAFVLLASISAEAQSSRSIGQDNRSYETRLMAMVNLERARHGLASLTLEQTLVEAGRMHSRDMASLGFFDHVHPSKNRRTPSDRWRVIVRKLPEAYVLAENLFYSTRADVGTAHKSLMSSPGHRKNILSRDFSRIGVGIHVESNGEMWVTQMFLGAN